MSANYQWRLTRAGTWVLSNGGADVGHAYQNRAGTWTAEPWGHEIRHFDNPTSARDWVETALAVRPERIIDRDIVFYAAEVEEMQRRLRRCVPSLESYYSARIDGARAVLDALTAYRAAMDAPHGFDTELER